MGDIKEHKKAREVYEQAKSAGQKAASSIRSGRTPSPIRSSISGRAKPWSCRSNTRRPVRQSGNEFSLRVPLVVAPRFMPAPIVQTVDFTAGGQGWGQTADPVPDRDRISPGAGSRAEPPPVNPVAVTVHLQAGFPLAEVNRYHHAVTLSEEAGGRLIKLADGPGAGRSRLRAGLDAGRDQRAVGRAVSRADRRRRLPARLRDAARGRG